MLINDFGRVNIDAVEFEGKSNSLVELTNGSIFCSCLKDDFITSLALLLDYEKDIILIEGSGLSDPSNMQDVLKVLANTTEKSFRFLGSVCILDGQYFLKEVQAMESVVRQISHSQLAVLNKTDLIDEDTRVEIREKTRSINSEIAIVETTHGSVSPADVIRILGATLNASETLESLNTPENRPLTLTANFHDIQDKSDLLDILKKILPHTERMKGFVWIGSQLYKAESVQDTIEIQPANMRTLKKIGFVIILKNGMASLREIQKMELERIRIQL